MPPLSSKRMHLDQETILASAHAHIKNIPDLMLQAETIVNAIVSDGLHTHKQAGPGENFWQFRPYEPQDRPQDIDWRQSAKNDGLYIRDKEKQNAQTVYIWCANSPSMEYQSDNKHPTKQNTAHLLCLCLALLIIRKYDKVAILGSNLKPSSSLQSLHKNAEYLRNAELQAIDTIDQHGISKNSTVICIGDFLEDTTFINNGLSSLSHIKNTCHLVQILDPAEITLPFEGRITFQDSAHTPITTVDHVGSIRDAYQTRMQEHINALKHMCEQQTWLYHLVQTHEMIIDPLLKIWMDLTQNTQRNR